MLSAAAFNEGDLGLLISTLASHIPDAQGLYLLRALEVDDARWVFPPVKWWESMQAVGSQREKRGLHQHEHE